MHPERDSVSSVIARDLRGAAPALVGLAVLFAADLLWDNWLQVLFAVLALIGVFSGLALVERAEKRRRAPRLAAEEQAALNRLYWPTLVITSALVVLMSSDVISGVAFGGLSLAAYAVRVGAYALWLQRRRAQAPPSTAP